MKPWIAKTVTWMAACYLVLDVTGLLLLARDANTPSPANRDWIVLDRLTYGKRWAEVQRLMAAIPPEGCPLVHSELERARALMWTALSCSPPEYEGGDMLPASLRTVQYLQLAYPGLKTRTFSYQGDKFIRVAQALQVISNGPIGGWKVPFVELGFSK